MATRLNKGLANRQGGMGNTLKPAADGAFKPLKVEKASAKAAVAASSNCPVQAAISQVIPASRAIRSKRIKVVQEIVRTAGKEGGFVSVRERPDNVQDIYIDEIGNESLVCAYVEHIYAYLHQREKDVVAANYMDKLSVNTRMRAILIDWMVSVQYKFHMCQDTLYLAVSIVDRFMSTPELDITKEELQLVGVTALFIASKFEEVYPPEVSDFAYIADNACTKAQILETELVISQTLNFDFTRPNSNHFLRRCSKAAQSDAEDYVMAKYICELALLDCSFVAVYSSLTAAAAMYLMLNIQAQRLADGSSMDLSDDSSTLWTADLEYYSMYKEKEVQPIAQRLLAMVQAAPTAKQQCIFKKYSSKKMFEVSTIVSQSVESLTLPQL
ncbi:hypothetical protein RvY_11098 [Ramazzottius varieornatus]|uniref:Uncharacterized protein n=1 Tax=Ramazzottius varieornatus TaxID=947166 RepID=A0A1D1VHF6_RAMVA|nr:hypothetical protein RvY_11098 [Ramazzottius varieornatus]